MSLTTNTIDPRNNPSAIPDLSRYTLSDEECANLKLPPNIGSLDVELIPQCANSDGTYKSIVIACDDQGENSVTLTPTFSLVEILDACGSSQEYSSRFYIDISVELSRGVSRMDLLALLMNSSPSNVETVNGYRRFKAIANLHQPLNYYMMVLSPTGSPGSEYIVFPRTYVRTDTLELSYNISTPRVTTLNLRAVQANINGEKLVGEFYQRINNGTTDTTQATTDDNPTTSSVIFGAGTNG